MRGSPCYQDSNSNEGDLAKLLFSSFSLIVEGCLVKAPRKKLLFHTSAATLVHTGTEHSSKEQRSIWHPWCPCRKSSGMSTEAGVGLQPSAFLSLETFLFQGMAQKRLPLLFACAALMLHMYVYPEPKSTGAFLHPQPSTILQGVCFVPRNSQSTGHINIHKGKKTTQLNVYFYIGKIKLKKF